MLDGNGLRLNRRKKYNVSLMSSKGVKIVENRLNFVS